jgi:predicted N-acetyltransferase YhbS
MILDKESQMTMIYSMEPELSPEEFVDVLHRSGLAERRPVDDPVRVERMVKNANLIVTARENGTLIGVARAVTDFSYCCYLSDLAVDRACQRQGIGKELMRRTHEAAGEECTLLLLSAPAAMDYYPHVGFEKVENAFMVRRRK